jgi:hypothetical protein
MSIHPLPHWAELVESVRIGPLSDELDLLDYISRSEPLSECGGVADRLNIPVSARRRPRLLAPPQQFREDDR